MAALIKRLKETAYAEERRENMERQKVKGFRDFLREEDGMGTVEVILIIVVLVGLVVLFKNQITAIVQTLFSKITSQVDKM